MDDQLWERELERQRSVQAWVKSAPLSLALFLGGGVIGLYVMKQLMARLDWPPAFAFWVSGSGALILIAFVAFVAWTAWRRRRSPTKK